MANALHCIHPVKKDGVWSFTDKAKDLEDEPFVTDAGEVIDVLSSAIPDAENGFNLYFSEAPFKGAAIKLTHVGEEVGGNSYRINDTHVTAWLCPALLKYFKEPPKQIFAMAA